MFRLDINRQIEDFVKSCDICIRNQKKQTSASMIPSHIVVYPFQVIGRDFLHWNGQDFLLVVEHHNKYWEIGRLHNISSALVIKKMKMIFSRLGFPEVVRGDNGTRCLSRTFR